jgi:hypothetical protein
MRNRTERLSDLLDWKRLHVYYTKVRLYGTVCFRSAFNQKKVQLPTFIRLFFSLVAYFYLFIDSFIFLTMFRPSFVEEMLAELVIQKNCF